ncbi:MAG TPA: nuclear transport factor 2 family protein [Caldimonas sp.]|nr:nuclear transport factor 2 family protein [Caldimonas sp.]
MKTFASLCCLAGALFAVSPARAQVAVQAAADQPALLASADPRIAANKRLVFDFWREVFEGAHMELASKYMTESYIQHNPNVPSGRAAFVDFFSKMRKPTPIEPHIKAPLVAIVAEGDLVVLSFAREGVDPKDATRKFSTTWFDMFRIENGKIAEHWDPAQKQ